MKNRVNVKKFRTLAAELADAAQLGISIVVPIVALTLTGVWIQRKCSAGGWVVMAGIFCGLMTAFSTVRGFYRTHVKQAEKETSAEISFNNHE